MSAPSLAQYMAAIPMQSGGCTTLGSNATVVLPDHCCWYGVACCGPQTCSGDPFCNCTVGLVTALQLNSNQVHVVPLSFVSSLGSDPSLCDVELPLLITGLSGLLLSSAQLSGKLSQAGAGAASLSCSLTSVQLQSNRLMGTVPSEQLWGLTGLELLNFAYNALTGM